MTDIEDRLTPAELADLRTAREHDRRVREMLRRRVLEDRVARMETALTEIKKIAEISEGPAAKFYGMLASTALEEE